MRWAWEAAESWSMSAVEGEGGGCGIVGLFCPIPLVSESEWLFTVEYNTTKTGWKVAVGSMLVGQVCWTANEQVVIYCEI